MAVKLWAEAWTRPGDPDFRRVIADLPVIRGSHTSRLNGVGGGDLRVPRDYDRLTDILYGDSDTPANSVSTLIRIFSESQSAPIAEFIPIGRHPETDTRDPDVEIVGEGIERVLAYARTEPWDWDGGDDFTSRWPDWIWGGRNVLGTLSGRYEPYVVEVRLNNADDGTFTITVTNDAGVDTTAPIDHAATATTVDTAVTALSNVTFVDVTGGAGSWVLKFDDETTSQGVTVSVAGISGNWQLAVNYHTTGGTFTLTADGNTSAAIAYNVTAAALKTAIEAITGITTVTVTKVTRADGNQYWDVFFDTPDSVATFTVNDTGLTGDGSEAASITQFTPSATVDQYPDGGVLPAGWEISKSYLSDLPHGPVSGFRLWASGDPALPAGCDTAIRFDGGEPYFPGVQKVVPVKPGGRYQASAKILSQGSGETIRLVIRDLAENILATVTGVSSDEQTTVASTWTDFTIPDIIIPDNVSEVVYRIGHVGSGDPVAIFVACPEMNEGLAPTTVGGILKALYDDATTNHQGRVVWDDGTGTPYLTLDFTAVLDSDGNAWDDPEVPLTIKRGMSFLGVIAEVAKLGYEWRLVPNAWASGTWKLQVYNPGGLGSDLTASAGPSIEGGADDIRRDIRAFLPAYSDVLAEGLDQYTTRTRDLNLISAIGRIEGYRPVRDLGASAASLEAADSLAAAIAKTQSLNYVLSGESTEPLVDWTVGDLIIVQDPPEVPKQTRRVSSITLTWGPTVQYQVALGSESFVGEQAVFEAVRVLTAEFKAIRLEGGEGAEVERLAQVATEVDCCAESSQMIDAVTTYYTDNRISHDISLSSASPGDLLIAAIAWWSGMTVSTAPTGWVLLGSVYGSGERTYIYYKIADGTEGSTATWTTTSAAGSTAAGVWTVRNPGIDFSAYPPEMTSATSTLNPPGISPSWGNGDALVYAGISFRDYNSVTVPSGYSEIIDAERAVSQEAEMVVAQQRVAITVTEDPATYTAIGSGGPYSDAWTVAVRGQAGPIIISDHGGLSGLTDDDHTQYLKEKASGGLAAEVPVHDHSGAAEAGTIAHSATTGKTANDHHAEAHTVASHSDTTATGAELETLTDGSDADSLHDHAGLLKTDGSRQTTYLDVSGRTGATAASRYVGATASGSPVSGTHAVGDYIVDQSGSIWICTVAGTPGTWVELGAAGALTSHDHTSGAGDGGILTADEHDSYSEYAEIAAPGTPGAGKVRLYFKTDGKAYIKDDAGTETDLTGGGSTAYPYTQADEPPTTPHANNEEMDGALTGWTWQASSGTPTNQTLGEWQEGPPANPSYNVDTDLTGTLVMQPTAKLKVYRAWPFAAGVRSGVVAKLRLARAIDTDDRLSLCIERDTPTASSDEPVRGHVLQLRRNGAAMETRYYRFNGGGALGGISPTADSHETTAYLAYTTRTDNTIDAWWSTDGIGWARVAAVSGEDINGNIGYVFISVQQGGSNAPVAIVDWVRFLSGTGNLWAVSAPGGG